MADQKSEYIQKSEPQRKNPKSQKIPQKRIAVSYTHLAGTAIYAALLQDIRNAHAGKLHFSFSFFFFFSFSIPARAQSDKDFLYREKNSNLRVPEAQKALVQAKQMGRKNMKASELMEELLGWAEQKICPTVDTCKAGDPKKQVKRVGTCFIATPNVIARAAAWGADLLITHEPTYYCLLYTSRCV